jgi:GIY-YIG catalytic domain
VLKVNLNDLLSGKGVDPEKVLVFRHRPKEPELNRVLPWLAAERPELYNAYQQTQGKKLERAMLHRDYVASFIGKEAGKALFVGLYSIHGSKAMNAAQFWKVPAHQQLRDKFGMIGFNPKKEKRTSLLWFELLPTNFYPEWKGKLVVKWPPPETSWWRRAHRNEMPVLAVLEESVLDKAMPSWDEISLTWEQVAVLPTRWRMVLSQWRGIYYIFDTSDGKGYVGSACGNENLLGRWRNYAPSGHGGNVLLRKRNPKNFRFTILQRVSPDMEVDEIIRLENTWKQRLHSRHPLGLNEN